MDPPAKGPTLALWLIPAAAAATGVALLVTRRRPAAEPGDLTDAERERVSEAVTRMRATADDEDGL